MRKSARQKFRRQRTERLRRFATEKLTALTTQARSRNGRQPRQPLACRPPQVPHSRTGSIEIDRRPAWGASSAFHNARSADGSVPGRQTWPLLIFPWSDFLCLNGVSVFSCQENLNAPGDDHQDQQHAHAVQYAFVDCRAHEIPPFQPHSRSSRFDLVDAISDGAIGFERAAGRNVAIQDYFATSAGLAARRQVRLNKQSQR